MVTTVLVAGLTALILCFFASLVEDFVLPRQRRSAKLLRPPSEDRHASKSS